MTPLLRATCALWLLAGPGPTRDGCAQNGNRAAILAADRSVSERSIRDGLPNALGGALAPDGALLWPGAPVVRGPDNARRLLAGTPADSVVLAWQPLGLAASADSTLGLTWGVAVRTTRLASSAPRFGRYLAGWRFTGRGCELVAIAFLGDAAPPVQSWGALPLELAALAPGGNAGAYVAADLEFARLAADSGAALAFERWAAPEAVLPGGILSIGPPAIGRAIAAGGPAAWRWYPVLAWSSGLGDFGITVGQATITPPGGPPAFSKYLTAWRRLRPGQIRFLADGGNARPPAP